MKRSIWKGSISFGLLNIPVSLLSAEDKKEQLKFSMLDRKSLAPIKYKKISADTGREIPYEQIVKGYEYEDGEYVLLSKKDFEEANVKATQTIDIEDFVLLEDIDPMLFEKPYYLIPQKAGKKGYALLRDALIRAKKVAVGKVVIRTKQHLCLVMARDEYLILEILRFAHEITEVAEAGFLKELNMEKKPYSPRELKMAEELIDSMTADWVPDKYKDTYYADLMKRIQQKVKRGESHTIEIEGERETRGRRAGQVVDLLPLLQQSLKDKKERQRRKVR